MHTKNFNLDKESLKVMGQALALFLSQTKDVPATWKQRGDIYTAEKVQNRLDLAQELCISVEDAVKDIEELEEKEKLEEGSVVCHICPTCESIKNNYQGEVDGKPQYKCRDCDTVFLGEHLP